MNSIQKKKVEECWVLVGQRREGVWISRRCCYSIGEPTKVAFDARWTLEREETHGDVVGFLHTHPAGSPTPSRRDLRTMRAWARSFGKPMLCVIATPHRTRGYVFDGKHRHEVDRIVQFNGELTVVVE
jgi:proteasome lid subunit RPN8/RPN11